MNLFQDTKCDDISFYYHLFLNSFIYWSIFGDSAHCASLADQCRTRQHSIRSTHLPLHDLFCGLLQSVPKILNTACRPSWASNFGLVESEHANSCNVNTASHFDLMIFCLLTRPGNLCTMIQRTHAYYLLPPKKNRFLIRYNLQSVGYY